MGQKLTLYAEREKEVGTGRLCTTTNKPNDSSAVVASSPKTVYVLVAPTFLLNMNQDLVDEWIPIDSIQDPSSIEAWCNEKTHNMLLNATPGSPYYHPNITKYIADVVVLRHVCQQLQQVQGPTRYAVIVTRHYSAGRPDFNYAGDYRNPTITLTDGTVMDATSMSCVQWHFRGLHWYPEQSGSSHTEIPGFSFEELVKRVGKVLKEKTPSSSTPTTIKALVQEMKIQLPVMTFDNRVAAPLPSSKLRERLGHFERLVLKMLP